MNSAAASLIGRLGVLLCLASGLVRLMGYAHAFGLEVESFFILGIGLMVLSIMLKLGTK